jgi:hypothetical protein
LSQYEATDEPWSLTGDSHDRYQTSNQTRAVAKALEPKDRRINRRDTAQAGVAAPYNPRRNLTPAQTRAGRDLCTSKRRVQQVIDLAFLAPDIVRDITNGVQPMGLTSDWCLRHDLPSEWQAQRQRIATL